MPYLGDGDHEIPNNNRPISLLSKVTEKTSLNQFNDFLTQQGNLTCHRSENSKYHFTDTLNLLASAHILKAMGKKEIKAMVLCHRTLLLNVARAWCVK